MNISNETFFESQCMFICDQITLEILDVNQNVELILGYSRNEILGVKLTAIASREKVDLSIIQADKNMIDTAGQFWKIRCKNSNSMLVQFSSHIINYKKHPSKLIVAHDVSSLTHKGNDPDVLSSPIGFQDFPLAEIEWNRESRILRWSRKAEELFGWTQEELNKVDDILELLIHPEDLDLVRKEVSENLRQHKKNTSMVNRNITKSGEVISCEWYNSYLFNAQGEIVSTYSLVSDVSSRVEAMDRSLRVMESYRDLFDSISDAIYLIDNNGTIVGANKGVKLIYGYDQDYLIGKKYTILSPPGKQLPDRLDDMQEAVLKHKGSGSAKYESWGLKSNGEVFPTEFFVNMGSYFGQEVLIIIERDVSDIKAAQEEFQKRESLLNELFNTSPLGIALLDEHQEIVEVNKGFENLFGYELKEIRGLELDRLIVSEEDREEAYRLSATPVVKEVSAQRLTKQGELVDVLIYSVPIILDGKMINKYGIYVDISDRRKAEEQLRTSLKEKEVLLAEIHHRVKNNLAVITGLLELQSYNTKNESAINILRESQMRIHSIAMVHEKLYHNERLSEIQIHEYIEELTRVVGRTMGNKQTDVEIRYDLDEVSLLVTQAVPCGLLLNEVLTNSFKHAFRGQQKGRVKISFKEEKEGHLTFSIKDNGIGFDTSLMNKKSKSLGMKLILTLSKQLNAKMKVKSGKEGSSFIFTFRNEM